MGPFFNLMCNFQYWAYNMGLDSFAHITYLFIFPWMSLEPLEGGVWTMKWVHSTHGCSLWKSIRAAWDDLINYVCFEMGVGDSVRFLAW